MPTLRDTIAKSRALVVTAAPGAGKTTRLPPELLKITDKKVLVLEPRRIAAISASQRIAEENRWTLGKEVGYQVRFENKSSRVTRLLFLTEALLLRKLLADPELSDVDCVVLDEFHERSLHVDLAIGALRELQELARPDLKIVAMSATLNAAPLAAFLGGAPVVDVPGKIFPLEVKHENKAQLLRTGPDFTDRMQRLVERAVSEKSEGDVLCFLPGRGEIERLRQALQNFAGSRDIALYPLHGQLNLQEQRQAIATLPGGRRKIILATNVAESSLTVEGVRIVVDSGLARIAQLHPRTGYESLDLVRISKASSTQRAGRAARLGPGTVYKAWSLHDEPSFQEFEPAEVMRSDLSESVLLLSALGVTNVESFSWYEKPPAGSLQQAKNFLAAIGALAEDGALTALGKKLRAIPAHPRLALLLLEGKELGLARFASELAALLSEGGGRIPRDAAYESENDLWVRWEEWKRSSNHPKSYALQRVADQLRTLVEAQEGGEVPGKPRSRHELEHEMHALLLDVYTDRLCRRRRAGDPQAKLAGGRGVKLHPESTVRQSEFFLALELSEGRDIAETTVFQAIGLSEELVERKLGGLAKKSTRLEWDDDKNRFWAIEAREWKGITFGHEHRRPADPAEIEGQLGALALQRWDRLLAVNEDLGHFFARLRFLAKTQPKFPLPTEEKLREALDQACYGENSLEKVSAKNLVPFFENALEDSHREAVRRECPPAWTAPTGNKFKIQYTEEQGPQVEVRLQEVFGLASAPLIAGQPLTMSLLAPNYRPVQITRDLTSFWKNGYAEVRKEMRARYPKHSWPEDPLAAPPQAKGRSTKAPR